MRTATLVGLITLVGLTAPVAPTARAEPATWSLDVLPGTRGSVTSVGDVDGDGVEDQVVLTTARAEVWLGRGRTPPGPSPLDWSHDYAMPTLNDPLYVVPAGDVDGDGHADFALGGTTAGATADLPGYLDYVVVCRGADRPTIVAPSPWVVAARTPGTRFGAAMAAGDVNGDGFTDLAIGAPGDPGDPLASGRVVLYLGSPAGLEAREAWAVERASGFGTALAMLDHDGDGLDDLVVGGPAGVEWFRGQQRRDDHELDLAPLAIEGDTLTTGPVVGGHGLTSLGDFDGDGLADALRVDVAGDALEILYGAADAASERARTLALESWGLTLVGLRHEGIIDATAAGDLDGDGRTDLALAAFASDAVPEAPGEAFVVFGSTAVALTPVRLEGLTAYEVFGLGDYDGDGLADLRVDHDLAFGRTSSVGDPVELAPAELTAAGVTAFDVTRAECAGDVDADGFDDLVLSGRGQSNAGCVACAPAQLLRGGPSGLTPAFADLGRPGDVERTFVAPGDLDGDGHPDLLAFSEQAPAGGRPNAGRAELYWGAATPAGVAREPAWELTGASADSHLGHQASPAGDGDGDGLMEVVFGVAATTHGPDAGLFAFRDGTLVETYVWTTELPAVDGVIRETPTGLGDVSGDGLADLGFLRIDTTATRARTLGLQHGTASGPDTPSSIDIGQAALDRLRPVGDLDGDGLADLVGLSGGRQGDRAVAAHVLYGTPTLVRPTATPLVVVTDAELDEDGHSELPVATRAGDLDGDGFADFAVVAPARTSSRPGRLAVFRGGPAGVAPDYVRDAEYYGHGLGSSVTGGCDLDGDGFADLVTASSGDAGRGLDVHYGNGGLGHRAAFAYAATALQPDLSGPIAPGGSSRSSTSFAVRALGRSPFGPSKVRLEVEAKPLGVPFDGRALAVGAFGRAVAGESVAVTARVEDLAPDTAYHWRARIAYASARAPRVGHSRWFRGGEGPLSGGADVRTRANTAPVARDVVYFAESGVVTEEKPGALGEVTDADGDPITFGVAIQPRHGYLAVFSSTGAFGYVADQDYEGLDQFTFEVSDGLGPAVRATATIVVGRCDRCARGDYFQVVRLRSGALRSIHCWLEDDGTPTCETGPDGLVVLREPMCQ